MNASKVSKIIGQLAEAQRKLGPVIGQIRKEFPDSTTLRGQAVAIYDRINSLKLTLAEIIREK